MTYKPAPVPFDEKGLVEYLNRELSRFASEHNKVANGAMVVYHVEPEHPVDGLYYADGSDWNPGSGRGLYRFDSSGSGTFVFIG